MGDRLMLMLEIRIAHYQDDYNNYYPVIIMTSLVPTIILKFNLIVDAFNAIRGKLRVNADFSHWD